MNIKELRSQMGLSQSKFAAMFDIKELGTGKAHSARLCREYDKNSSRITGNPHRR